MKSSLRSWLGLERSPSEPLDALRDLLDALDRIEPARARYLAQFAYLLGRVAHADQHVSPGETEMMERLVRDQGGLAADQAMLVVGLAKTANQLFGGTDNFIVAREYAEHATYDQKVALMRCLFALSSFEGRISIDEEREIQRVGRELRVDAADLLKLRLEYRRHLPGLSDREDA
jgi:uncharacterized tellurite resistance protein B-like protein